MSSKISAEFSVGSTTTTPIGKIHPHLHSLFEQIMKKLGNRLLFNKDLTNDRAQFIIDHRQTMEQDFTVFLQDCVDELIVDIDLRQRLIGNILEFSRDWILVHNYNHINFATFAHFDSGDESDIDVVSDDSTSSRYDQYDDLENLLLAQMELENDSYTE